MGKATLPSGLLSSPNGGLIGPVAPKLKGNFSPRIIMCTPRCIRIVFCDQSNGFDRVWHQGLLYKLECIGITGDLLEWFHSYLDNRKQRVIIHGSNSRWGKIPAGVPKGAHLGPLLFLIYINDITENIKSNIKLFDDDTSLYVNLHGDAVNATKQLNDDLTQIGAWADNWLVKFNASKSKALTISLKKNRYH